MKKLSLRCWGSNEKACLTCKKDISDTHPNRKYPDDEEIKERLKEASSLVDDIKKQIKKQTNEHNPQNP